MTNKPEQLVPDVRPQRRIVVLLVEIIVYRRDSVRITLPIGVHVCQLAIVSLLTLRLEFLTFGANLVSEYFRKLERPTKRKEAVATCTLLVPKVTEITGKVEYPYVRACHT